MTRSSAVRAAISAVPVAGTHDRAMALHGTLGAARGAGGIADHRQIRRLARQRR